MVVALAQSIPLQVSWSRTSQSSGARHSSGLSTSRRLAGRSALLIITTHRPTLRPLSALCSGSSPAMSLTYTKKEEESGLSSYYNNKTTIIQEARVFNESPISPRKCRALLTRIVYLLYIGETFGTQEATTLFFGTTKLFQHKDVSESDLLQ